MKFFKNGVQGCFILTILLIYPLPQLVIDIYLPSWPAMTLALHTNESHLQLTLTVYLLSLGLAQLIYGPCSDRYGRKPVLLIGTAIFSIASIIAVFSQSIPQLLILRILQGLGIGCGLSVANAILADIFQGKQLAKLTTYAAMIYSLAPILAPVLGGYLQHYIGWRANFAVMAIYGVGLFFSILLFVFETNSRTIGKTLTLIGVIKNYGSLFSNIHFAGNWLCLPLSYGLMIIFNIVGPFLLQNTLHISPVTYGQLVLLVGISYFVGATLNSQYLKYFTVHQSIIFGLAEMLFAGLGLLIVELLLGLSIFTVIFFTCFAVLGMGFVYPNCFANAMGMYPEKNGLVSAFIGSGILVGVSIISVIVAHLPVPAEYCLSVGYLLLTILCIGVYSLTRLTIDTKTTVTLN